MTTLLERLEADIRAELDGARPGQTDVRGELLFRCLPLLAPSGAPIEENVLQGIAAEHVRKMTDEVGPEIEADLRQAHATAVELRHPRPSGAPGGWREAVEELVYALDGKWDKSSARLRDAIHAVEMLMLAAPEPVEEGKRSSWPAQIGPAYKALSEEAEQLRAALEKIRDEPHDPDNQQTATARIIDAKHIARSALKEAGHG